MYSIHSITEQNKFISSELNKKFLQFPKEVEASYSRVYLWLIQQAENTENFIRNGKFDLDYYNADPNYEASNWKGAAYEFSRLLPGHTLKAYKLFLQIENETKSSLNENIILDTPILSIIDNGCGGGSVTIALLTLIMNFQEFRIFNGQSVFPIRLNCLGIDPNHVALQIYENFLKECINGAKRLLIDIDIMTIIGVLPEHDGEIIIWLNEKNRLQNLVIGLGNVIRPITKDYESTKELLKFLRLPLRLPKNFATGIGYKEIDTIKTLLDNSLIDCVITAMVGSDTINDDDRKASKSWNVEVEEFQRIIKRELVKHKILVQTNRRENVSFLGPPDNFYRKFDNNQNPFSADFELAYSLVENNHFSVDKEWLNVLDEKNLLLAWARVRNELNYFQINDSVEIRLFELNIIERIKKLRRDILSYRWESLNIGFMFNFFSPKGEDKSPRPLNLCRLEEQILAVAIVQAKGQDAFEFHPRSFAYKLTKKKKGEFLYEDWYEAHSKYLNDARNAASKKTDHCVIRTDIESFYTRINQISLRDELIHISKLYYSRVKDIIHLLLIRHFDWEANTGIPQGHAVSGIFSDIYLHPIDKKFGDKYQFEIEYFRYVDDIIIICTTAEAERILGELDAELHKLGLNISKEKTEIQTTNDFLQQIEKDQLLDVLGKEHNRLLREIYKLDDKHYSFSQENWWEFLKKYQNILFNLNIYLGIPRLSRKIKASENWWNRTFNFWKSTKFPYVTEMKDLGDVERWVSIFNEQNPNWIAQRQLIQENLLSIFNDGMNTLESSQNQNDLAKAQTKIKFAIYRLGQLGFGDCTETVTKIIIERPWIINIRNATQSLGLQNQEESLIRIYFETPNDKPQWSYVKSCALKALLELPKPSERTIKILSDIIASDRSILERIMATEVLLLSKNINNPEIKNIQELLKLNQEPYLAKNLVLLAYKFNPDNVSENVQLGSADILNEAIQFGKLRCDFEELYRYEPDILRDYYYGEYPDNSKEFREPPT